MHGPQDGPHRGVPGQLLHQAHRHEREHGGADGDKGVRAQDDGLAVRPLPLPGPAHVRVHPDVRLRRLQPRRPARPLDRPDRPRAPHPGRAAGALVPSVHPPAAIPPGRRRCSLSLPQAASYGRAAETLPRPTPHFRRETISTRPETSRIRARVHSATQASAKVVSY